MSCSPRCRSAGLERNKLLEERRPPKVVVPVEERGGDEDAVPLPGDLRPAEGLEGEPARMLARSRSSVADSGRLAKGVRVAKEKKEMSLGSGGEGLAGCRWLETTERGGCAAEAVTSEPGCHVRLGDGAG